MAVLVDRFDRHAHRIAQIAVVVSVVLASGLALAQGNRLRFPDERAYVELARDVAERDAFASFEYPALAASLADKRFASMSPAPLTAYRPPTYPLVLGALHTLGAKPVAMRIAGALLLGLAVWLLWLLLRPVLGRAAAALACVVTAVWPVLVFTAVSLYPQVLSLVLLLAVLLCARRATQAATTRPRLAWAASAGLAWGALLLAVPALGAAVLATGAVLLVARRRTASRLLAATALVCAALLPAAWALRNASAIGAAVPHVD